MSQAPLFDRLERLLSSVEIHINGNNPWDITVKNRKFPSRILAGGSLALGESYMEGWWECQALDQLFYRLLNAGIEKKVRSSAVMLAVYLKSRLVNLQNRSRAFMVGKVHYDLGYELFKHMLDQRMIYSCGYWARAKTLNEAQEAKLELIARKLKLEPGMTVLDIGCGWGGLARYFADTYKVKVTGITISEDQAKQAVKTCKGLDVEIRLQDYRCLNEKFDRIVSVGMFEHVGPRNYVSYFKSVERCLKDNGLHLLHTIGSNETGGYGMDPWLDKYIFPNAVLPTASSIVKAIEHRFKIEDWHNFGTFYDLTLMKWHENFNRNWKHLSHHYDQRFFRMWNYYLLCCAATFRSCVNGLWQIVLSKKKESLVYLSVR